MSSSQSAVPNNPKYLLLILILLGSDIFVNNPPYNLRKHPPHSNESNSPTYSPITESYKKETLLIQPRKVWESPIYENERPIYRAANSSHLGTTWMSRPIFWIWGENLGLRKTNNKVNHYLYGNRARKNLKLVAWNQGSKEWSKKTNKIELLIKDFNPDVLIISEANIQRSTNLKENAIKGYTLHQSKALEDPLIRADKMGVLVRDGISTKRMGEFMEPDICLVWLNLKIPEMKSIAVGRIYREHRLLIPNNDQTYTEVAQLGRYWIGATRDKPAIVMGDINVNLDIKVEDRGLMRKFYNLLTTKVQNSGFIKLVEDPTHNNSTNPPSRNDHIWTNVPEVIINTRNIL